MKREPEQIQNQHFDVLIAGGGITGAAVAYEAASRGFTVALFEKNDFGGATSAATSKMIHGGLRYLAKMEFGLVRESLRERKILMNIAPNLVHPAPFLIPSYKKEKTPAWMIKLAMILYDLLSLGNKRLKDAGKSMPFHKSVSKKQILLSEPEILEKGLRNGQVYYDGISFSPERLTLAFLKSAVKSGAKILNYTEVKQILFSNNEKRVSGILVQDKISGNSFSVNGNWIINCTGPWTDQVVQKSLKEGSSTKIRRSEGIHIITPKLVNNIVTLSTKSGRHCFIVPWRGCSLIGTTDKEFYGNPDDYKVSRQSVQELINEVNQVFGQSVKIDVNEVKFVYGGLRPLVEKNTSDVYHSSRKYEIINHKKENIAGLITVEGGKYTTSRNLAEKVVDLLIKEQKQINLKEGTLKKSVSKKAFLESCAIGSMKNYVFSQQIKYADFEKNQVEYLLKMYGTELNSLLVLAEKENLKEPLNNEGEIEAQVIYAIRKEMAVKLSDILLRRTGLGTCGYPGKKVLNRIAALAASELNWSNEKLQQEINEMEEIFKVPGKSETKI